MTADGWTLVKVGRSFLHRFKAFCALGSGYMLWSIWFSGLYSEKALNLILLLQENQSNSCPYCGNREEMKRFSRGLLGRLYMTQFYKLLEFFHIMFPQTC